MTQGYPEWLLSDERAIIEAVLLTAEKRGLLCSVYDGEEWTVNSTFNYADVRREIAATDMTQLRFRSPMRNAEGRRPVLGSVLLIHGNGADVIADYSETPEIASLLREAAGVCDLLDADLYV